MEERKGRGVGWAEDQWLNAHLKACLALEGAAKV